MRDMFKAPTSTTSVSKTLHSQRLPLTDARIFQNNDKSLAISMLHFFRYGLKFHIKYILVSMLISKKLRSQHQFPWLQTGSAGLFMAIPRMRCNDPFSIGS
jgi:hypothetical protein